MSLPSGYTRLEWIESTGTQWVDTKFTPNQDTRVVMDATLLNLSDSNVGAFLFGSGYPVQQSGFEAYVYGNVFCGVYNGTQVSGTTTMSAGQRLHVDFNKTVCTVTVDGVIVYSSTFTSASFQSAVNLALFVLPRQSKYYGVIRFYFCRIYDDGTLARDYVPCVSPAGAVGLYDLVGGQFYGNPGTGTFTAGPEVPQGPDTPKNLTAARADATHFALSWNAVEDATGYKVYRDGVLASTQTATNYTAVVEPLQRVTFAVAAYNDDGESGSTTLTVKNFPDNLMTLLITDRTQADVDRVAYLRGRVNGGTATESEQAEWETALKGAYNAGDLNRVGSAVDYLAERLTDQGYAVYVDPKVNYLAGDIPAESQMERYLADVREIRGKIAVMDTTPEAPASMDSLTYGGANDIEQILVDVDGLLTRAAQGWYFSGELYAAEV